MFNLRITGISCVLSENCRLFKTAVRTAALVGEED